MSGYLADTSVFIASEQRRRLGAPPAGPSRISVATLTELTVGVLRAPTDAIRSVRLETLDEAHRFVALPFDEGVARRLADLLAAARDAGRKPAVMDAIIAATALSHDLVVWTHDDDFEVLAELAPALRVARG